MISNKASNLNIAAKILLVSDEPDATSESKALIKNIKGNLSVVSNSDQVVAAFDAIEPEILLLVCMQIGKAEEYYLDLYRNSQKIQTTVHSSLLVCKAKDAERAYQLCLRELFDDYVIIRPLFDPFRLTISIRNLLIGQKTLKQSNELRQRVISIRDATSAMNQLVRESLSEGASVSAQLTQSELQISQHVKKKFRDLAEQMTSHDYDGVVKVVDQAVFNEKLSQFGQKDLSEEISTVFEESQTALNKLLKTFKTDYDVQTQGRNELEAWLNSIPPRILVVDDDPIFLEVITRMLTKEGFEVMSATNVTEGIHTATRLCPAAILLDYEMPEFSGLDFIVRAKALPNLRQVPIIMFTGHAEREVVQEAIAKGVSNILLKTSPKEIILQKLRSCIGLDIKA